MSNSKEDLLDSDILPFIATGENKMFSAFNYFGIGIIILLLISFLFLAKSITAFFSVLLILFILLFFLRKAIIKVEFDLDEIRILYLYGNKGVVKYQQLCKFYKNKEGFTPFYVYVVKYKINNSESLKKFTFWTDKYSETELKNLLINKKHKVHNNA